MSTSKIIQIKLLLATSIIAITVFSTLPAYAVSPPSDTGGNTTTSTSTAPGGNPACKNTTNAPALKNCVTTSPLVKDIQQIINFLSAGVGIIVIGVIILGGVQYSIAGDNPQATGAAKQRIINGLIALVAFIFAFAFLNWLLPGGAFG